jgi:hypothetical protein
MCGRQGEKIAMDSMTWWAVLQPGFSPTFDGTKNQAYTVTLPIKISQGEQHFEFAKGHLLRGEHPGIISVTKGMASIASTHISMASITAVTFTGH